MQDLPIFVQATNASVELLAFINIRIQQINKVGIKVKLYKVTNKSTKTIKHLTDNGATKLPAIVMGKTVIVGANKIILFINNKLKPKCVDPETSSGSDIADFWKKEIAQEVDTDDSEGAKLDLELKKNTRLQRLAINKEDEIETFKTKPATKSIPITYDLTDSGVDEKLANKAQKQINSNKPSARKQSEQQTKQASGCSGEDMDDRMMKAWAMNNVDG